MEHYLHLDLLKSKAKGCKNFEYKFIENTNHFYHSKEKEIGSLILEWMESIKD